MNYITKKITTEEGIFKLAFYKVIGRETPEWKIVDTIDWVWEYTQDELLDMEKNINMQLLDLQSKIELFNK